MTNFICGKPCNSASVILAEANQEPQREPAAACRRLLQASLMLPEGAFLGLQITAGSSEALVFSSPGVRVTKEDYRWIFGRCLSEISSGSNVPDFGAGRVYLLQPDEPEREERRSSCRDDDPVCEEAFVELFKALEAGAFRILAGQDGRGILALSLQEEMTLRMRAMLAMAFPHTVIMEFPSGTGEVRNLPKNLLRDTCTAFLTALAARSEVPKNEKTVPTTHTPLETLDLTVRTYNCLRRAGYHEAEELLPLTEADYREIRNLGRRGMEEIRQKLSELRLKPEQAPRVPEESAVTLDELIGLKTVKEQIAKITAFARMKRDMEQQGRVSIPLALNMEFAGNPGTAKTTVARILAGIFYELGLLTSREPVEVGRADLVARYVGQTADQVKSIFDLADGRLLFIDEAYALVDRVKGEFGDEAINTIVQEMENRRNRTVVIFAGYPEQMDAFFARNPGLRSRVPFRIVFSDYSAEEMAQIVELEVRKRGFSIGADAGATVAAICGAAAGDPKMGNGRFCRNLAERAILEYASRVYSADDAVGDFELTAADFKLPEPEDTPPEERRIGFAA